MDDEASLRFVAPIRIGSAVRRAQEEILLSIWYKLDPSEPEEYELRLLLERSHAQSLLSALDESFQALSGQDK